MPEAHREEVFYDIRGQYFPLHFMPRALTWKWGHSTYYFYLWKTFLKIIAHRDVHIHRKPHIIKYTMLCLRILHYMCMKCLLFLKSSIVIHYYTLISNDSRLRPMFLIKYIFVLFKYWIKALMWFVSFWTYLAQTVQTEKCHFLTQLNISKLICQISPKKANSLVE